MKKTSNTSKRQPAGQKKRQGNRKRPESRIRPIKSHEQVAVLNAPQQGNAAGYNSFWEIKKASTPGGMRCRGREMFATITTTDQSSDAFKWTTWLNSGNPYCHLHPAHFPRLSQLGKIFEWYFFHNARLIVTPTLPFSQAGNYAVAADFEPSDGPPTGSIGMTETMANLCSIMSPIYGKSSLEIPGSLARIKRFGTDIYDRTGRDAREDQVNQAVLYGRYSLPSRLEDNTVLAWVQLDYDVEFFAPQIAKSNDLLFKAPQGEKPLTLQSAEKSAKDKVKEAPPEVECRRTSSNVIVCPGKPSCLLNHD